MGLADLLRCMNMRGVCLNVVIRNDVLPLETSDCSENTDISYVMPTFLKKCYEDKKKIKAHFKTYLELLLLKGGLWQIIF